jgi:uncharacterized protein (TIGR03663 family)
LGLLFLARVSRQEWPKPSFRNLFLIVLIISFILLGMGFGIGGLSGGGEESVEVTALPKILMAVGGLGFLLAVILLLSGYTVERLRTERSFEMILLLGTLVLPQLAPFPVRWMGWDPLDYTNEGMVHTAIFLVPLILISIAIGLYWNPRKWVANAGIFYAIFTVFYTTVFTNIEGFFTGLVGSLGYWLAQQAVERGSQPLYYYAFLQIPIYEYLPALGCILALGVWLRRKRVSEEEVSSDERGKELQRRNLVFTFLAFWVITSLLAYTVAGEKMPWLTVHIAWPMILLSGWGIGKLIDRVEWQKIRFNQGILAAILLLVWLSATSAALGNLMGVNRPFQGAEVEQLQTTILFLLALLVAVISGWWLLQLIEGSNQTNLWRLMGLTLISLLAVLYARTGIRATFINYDYANEYLVYAHSAPGVKEALAQIEELSRRTTDGLGMAMGYDNDTTYPFWWYLRNFTNLRYYGGEPTRALRDAPAILVGANNYGKLAPIVGEAYYQFDYIRLWFPNQDYYNIKWDNINAELAHDRPPESGDMTLWEYLGGVWRHIKPFFTDPQVRQAVWEIWLNRDFTRYGNLTGRDFSSPNWEPNYRMRLYVRKDVAAQVWEYGTSQARGAVDMFPYEGGEIELDADLVVGVEGSGEGQFKFPRGVAVAQDGSVYVTDGDNHRIQHLAQDGSMLGVWGSFGDINEGSAPGGTFNQPWGITVGPDGSVYITDTWNHRIQKFTAEGEFVTMWGEFGQAESGNAIWGPRDIAVSAEGQVFVSDTGNKRVVVFDEMGNPLNEFDDPGLSLGLFLNEPVGVALDTEGQVYLVDTWNQRVVVFAKQELEDYQGVLEWEIFGWYGESLENKPYIAVDENGGVFVTEPEGYRVLEFNSQGEFVRTWGDFGDGPGDFNLPTGIALDPNGGLWVTDTGNHRVMHFSVP